MVEGYLNGEHTLLEVLNAERTHHKLQEDYNHRLYQYAEALITLEFKTGLWDIDFEKE